MQWSIHCSIDHIIFCKTSFGLNVPAGSEVGLMTPDVGGDVAPGEVMAAATAFLACLRRMDIVTGTLVGPLPLSTGDLFKLLRLDERHRRRLG